jgi:hypothetical protein
MIQPRLMRGEVHANQGHLGPQGFLGNQGHLGSQGFLRNEGLLPKPDKRAALLLDKGRARTRIFFDMDMTF